MQLHAAAARGDLAGVLSALAAGTEASVRNPQKQTALVFALERARGFHPQHGPKVTPAVVEALLNAGVPTETPDHLDLTALHRAVSIPDPRFLEHLLSRGANPRHVTDSGYTAAVHACYQPPSAAKRTILTRLHQLGVSLDTGSSYGEFPLGVCLHFGDFETLEHLLKLGADPAPLHWTPWHQFAVRTDTPEPPSPLPVADVLNQKNVRFELSPWQLAVCRGQVSRVVQFAERGADLTQIGRCGDSLLHFATKFGHSSLVRWLLDYGADPNSTNQFQKTPLHTAAESDHVDCARLLLEHGARGTAEDHSEGQPIHAACSTEMLRLLVERGAADVNAIDGCGDWPLTLAAGDNDVERIRWLLQHGAEVDRTSTGETALHRAVREDSREAVDLLLQAGANPNAEDVDGWTPLFGAASLEVIHNLLAAGANPHVTDQCSQGPQRWIEDPILVRALSSQR